MKSFLLKSVNLKCLSEPDDTIQTESSACEAGWVGTCVQHERQWGCVMSPAWEDEQLRDNLSQIFKKQKRLGIRDGAQCKSLGEETDR